MLYSISDREVGFSEGIIMRSILKEKGESRAFLIFSLINAVFYASWEIIYFVCILLRNQAFNTAQSNMVLSGHTTYTVEVTSPMFAVLKFTSVLLPVFLGVWTAMLLINDKKRKQLYDKWLVVAVFVTDLVCALTVVMDITMLHMIF